MNMEKAETTDRREYFRNYMRNRYKANPEKARAYKKTQRLLNSEKAPSNQEYCDKFGIYLADVMKIREMIDRLPPEMVKTLLFP